MVLVLLGTQKHNFTRLLDYINDLVNEGVIKEEVIVQLGHNKYKFTSDKVKSYDFLPHYEQSIAQADLIITHGGVGIIMQSLENQKKIIAIAREKRFNEHVDDHQQEMCTKFANDNYLVLCKDYNNLKKVYLNIYNMDFKKYEFNNKNFNEKINKLIDDLI